MSPFKLYLVGGAVRDLLLGREPHDRDYVAVGADLDDLRARFGELDVVGRSFPVAVVKGLGEVALARVERATGVGHRDFEIRADRSVTLEEDLSRRDLTINAMAMEVDLETLLPGALVDPFNGQHDLSGGVLRHVGPAFAEDALRVYRTARFAAQLGFSVAPMTMELLRSIPDEAMLALPGERVGNELRKAMAAPFASRFVQVLADADRLRLHFPELAALSEAPAGPPKHHPEGSALVHTLMVVNEAVRLGGSEVEVFAALCHDLGKGATPREEWPRHLGHEERGVSLVEALCDRLKLPTDHREAAVCASANHLRAHVFLEMNGGKRVDLIMAADRTALKAEGLALVAEADALGRGKGDAFDAGEHPLAKVAGARALRRAAPVARGVQHRNLKVPASLKGKEIGLFVRRARASAVNAALRGDCVF